MRTLLKDVLKDTIKPYKAKTGHKSSNYKLACGFNGKPGMIGPGGLNCPCCTPMHPSRLKVFTRRYIRRKLKQQLNTYHEEPTRSS